MEESLHPKESRGVVEREEGVVCGRVNKGGGGEGERERKLCNWKKYIRKERSEERNTAGPSGSSRSHLSAKNIKK
jgi:hypothetical protein